MIVSLLGCTILASYSCASTTGSRAMNRTQNTTTATTRSRPRRSPNRHDRVTVFAPSTFTVFPPFNLTAGLARRLRERSMRSRGATPVATGGHPDKLSHAGNLMCAGLLTIECLLVDAVYCATPGCFMICPPFDPLGSRLAVLRRP